MATNQQASEAAASDLPGALLAKDPVPDQHQHHDGERNEQQLHVEGGIRRVLPCVGHEQQAPRRSVQREPRPHQHERLFEGFQRDALTDAEQPQVDRRTETDERARVRACAEKESGGTRRAPPIPVSRSRRRSVRVSANRDPISPETTSPFSTPIGLRSIAEESGCSARPPPCWQRDAPRPASRSPASAPAE